jgi:eukaryotic-like serine/threonine-protein kinase
LTGSTDFWMALASGTRLCPYEIITPRGAGAMGQVYRARDTRLGRLVAIKVLTPAEGGDPPRLDRLEREARAIARVNHPHICALHDIGQQDGQAFLVMEYLEGETLASRLEAGAVPLTRAVLYGAEIADALDAAHQCGVIHRDLKPSNIMLTPAGVKVLDYGLAKLRDVDHDPAAMETAKLRQRSRLKPARFSAHIRTCRPNRWKAVPRMHAQTSLRSASSCTK